MTTRGRCAGDVDNWHVGDLLACVARHLPAVRSLCEGNVGYDSLEAPSIGVQFGNCLIAIVGGDDIEAGLIELGEQDLLDEDFVLNQQYFRHFYVGAPSCGKELLQTVPQDERLFAR